MSQWNFEQKTRLVRLLLACSYVGERDKRKAVIKELPNDVKNNVTRNPADQVDVMNLVNTCLEYDGGVDALIKVVRFFEGQSKARRALDEFWQAWLQKIDTFSEDGRPLSRNEERPPLEGFNTQSFLARLQAPGGAVSLRDHLYVKRQADSILQKDLVQWGTTTTIRASRQTGKTSLLMRGIDYAKKSGAEVVYFQNFARHQRSSPDALLYELAQSICHQLHLDESPVEKIWRGSLGPLQKIDLFLGYEMLPAFEVPIILAMDQADSLLQTSFYQDFFGLVRAWHNLRVSPFHSEQWEKLNIVLVISTEPLLLIDDLNQSPFNVGSRLILKDFTASQVSWLNQQYGSPVASQELPQLMNLLGGHPYLTRQALYTLVMQNTSWHELAQSALNDQGPFGQHLQRYYWAIHDKPVLKDSLKQVIRSNDCPDETSRLRLLKAGLIKEGGDCTCRCQLYRRYFERRLS